jgi:hypothetical protein
MELQAMTSSARFGPASPINNSFDQVDPAKWEMMMEQMGEKKLVHAHCLKMINRSPNSAALRTLLVIEKQFLRLLPSSFGEVPVILEHAEQFFTLSVLPLVACDVITHSTCFRLTDAERPMTTPIPFMRLSQSYDSQNSLGAIVSSEYHCSHRRANCALGLSLVSS